MSEILNTDIKTLSIPYRTRCYLGRAGITSLGQLLVRSEDEFLNIRGVGELSMDLVRTAIELYTSIWKGGIREARKG